jgi:putative oxidoreductase
MLDKCFSAAQGWAALFLRLSLGAVFFAHGAQKAFGWFGGYGWTPTMQAFTEKLGLPAPLAVLAILTELLGGIALLLGLGTRWAALLLGGEMLVAAVKVHLPNGFFMNWANAPNVGHGIEYNLTLIAALFALAAGGPGRFSLDALRASPATDRTSEGR